jgi:hypothetical protein
LDRRFPRRSAFATTLSAYQVSTGLPSCRSLPARIAASSSMTAGLKCCAIVRALINAAQAGAASLPDRELTLPTTGGAALAQLLDGVATNLARAVQVDQ